MPPFGLIINLASEFLYEEEKALFILSNSALVSDYAEHLAEARELFHLLQFWNAHFAIEDLQQQELDQFLSSSSEVWGFKSPTTPSD